MFMAPRMAEKIRTVENMGDLSVPRSSAGCYPLRFPGPPCSQAVVGKGGEIDGLGADPWPTSPAWWTRELVGAERVSSTAENRILQGPVEKGDCSSPTPTRATWLKPSPARCPAGCPRYAGRGPRHAVPRPRETQSGRADAGAHHPGRPDDRPEVDKPERETADGGRLGGGLRLSMLCQRVRSSPTLRSRSRAISMSS